MTTLHYASGHNVDEQGNYVPAQAGFNLADVSSVAQLDALPDGVKGLVWLDQGNGVTQDFIDQVTPFIGDPKLYGFFLKDEPDVTGNWGTQVSAADLKAESDWIHAHVDGAKTFITMMNMGSAADPSYVNTYENSGIDLFGISSYPVVSESGTVDYNLIDRNVAAAEAAGISADKIVPVYQTFGGGGWVDEGGGRYVMPTAAQEQQMLQHWEALVPNPVFDYAYAWGSQNGDVALESSQALQDIFKQHNASAATTPSTGSTPPVVDAGGSTNDGTHASTPPVVNAGGDSTGDTSGSTSPVADAGGSTNDGTHGSAPPVVNAGGDSTGDTSGSTSPVVDAGGNTNDGPHGSTPPVADAGGSAPPAGGTTTDPTPPIDPTPVRDHGAGHGFGQGGMDLGHGHGLDFSQLLGGSRLSGAESGQADIGGRHTWFGSVQTEDGGGWHGLNGLTQRVSGDASSFSDHSAESSDGGAHFSLSGDHHSVAAPGNSAALPHFTESLSEGLGRLGDQHWHW